MYHQVTVRENRVWFSLQVFCTGDKCAFVGGAERPPADASGMETGVAVSFGCVKSFV